MEHKDQSKPTMNPRPRLRLNTECETATVEIKLTAAERKLVYALVNRLCTVAAFESDHRQRLANELWFGDNPVALAKAADALSRAIDHLQDSFRDIDWREKKAPDGE